MRPERVGAMRYAGMLHDVGKLGVPTRVLQKSGDLTEEEFAAIQLHPMRGLEIVRDIGFLDEALAGIMHHHERMDGTGYPMGLAGSEIPEFARVISVADAFDSMTSTRSYRARARRARPIAELRRCAGTHFDPGAGRGVHRRDRARRLGPGPSRSPAGGRGDRDQWHSRTTTTRAHRCGSARKASDDAHDRRGPVAMRPTAEPAPAARRGSRLDSGQLLLIAVAGMLVIGPVTQVAAVGCHRLRARRCCSAR